MQHGGFLEVLKDLDDDAIIIYTDTDIKIQRPFNKSEIQLLNSCLDEEFILNEQAANNLFEDIKNLQPKITPQEILESFPETKDYKVFNTGVLVTKHKTYKSLYLKYNDYWHLVEPMFNSYVKQQWLITYVIQKHYNTRLLPYTIHCNAFSPPFYNHKNSSRGMIGEEPDIGFKFCMDSEVVVLNHHLRHDSHKEIVRMKKNNRLLLKIIAALVGIIVVLITTAIIKY
jgi:hypothetical protein